MRIIETFAHSQLKLAQNKPSWNTPQHKPQEKYWLPTSTAEKLPLNTNIEGHSVFKYRQGAEIVADQARLPRGTHAAVVPVKVLIPELLTNSQTHDSKLYAKLLHVIGQPELTSKATAKHQGQGKTFIQLFYLSGRTYGYHGRRGEEDQRADDCHQNVEWESELQISPQLEQALKGNPVVLGGASQIYFHSCSFTGEIYASFDSNLDEQIRQLAPDAFFSDGVPNIDSGIRDANVQSFIFQSTQQMIQEAAQLLDINAPNLAAPAPATQPIKPPQPNAKKPKPGQTPDDYWKKRTEIEVLKSKKPQPLDGD